MRDYKELAKQQKKVKVNGTSDGRSPAEIKADSEAEQRNYWEQRRLEARVERSPVIQELTSKIKKALEAYDFDKLTTGDIKAIHDNFKTDRRPFQDSKYGNNFDSLLTLISDRTESDPYKRNYPTNYSIEVTLAVVLKAIELLHSDIFIGRKLDVGTELVKYLKLDGDCKIDFLDYEDYDFTQDVQEKKTA